MYGIHWLLPHHGVGVDRYVARGEQHAFDARVERRFDHVLGAEHVGLDRLERVALDQVDLLKRRGVNPDVDVGHHVAEAGRIADVAGEGLILTSVDVTLIASGDT